MFCENSDFFLVRISSKRNLEWFFFGVKDFMDLGFQLVYSLDWDWNVEFLAIFVLDYGRALFIGLGFSRSVVDGY